MRLPVKCAGLTFRAGDWNLHPDKLSPLAAARVSITKTLIRSDDRPGSRTAILAMRHPVNTHSLGAAETICRVDETPEEFALLDARAQKALASIKLETVESMVQAWTRMALIRLSHDSTLAGSKMGSLLDLLSFMLNDPDGFGKLFPDFQGQRPEEAAEMRLSPREDLFEKIGHCIHGKRFDDDNPGDYLTSTFRMLANNKALRSLIPTKALAGCPMQIVGELGLSRDIAKAMPYDKVAFFGVIYDRIDKGETLRAVMDDLEKTAKLTPGERIALQIVILSLDRSYTPAIPNEFDPEKHSWVVGKEGRFLNKAGSEEEIDTDSVKKKETVPDAEKPEKKYGSGWLRRLFS